MRLSKMYFDTHAHLDQDNFDGDREGVIARAADAGVTDIVAIGVTADSSAACVALAAKHDGIHAAVGIQPNYVQEAKEGDWRRIVELADKPGVVALGET
ncbi:MAG: TatD family hydrolase, partial [Aeoliella sp.]